MAGPEEGWLLAPRSSTPGLALGTVGGSGPRSSGSSPAIDSCHEEDVTAPSSLSKRGASAPWLSCLSMLCQAWAGHSAPSPRQGTPSGAGGYFTGYFTCWHQLFLPSVPNHIPPAEPLTCLLRPPCPLPPPQGIAAAVPPFCSVPSFAPLPWHSLFSLWPSAGATGTGFFLLGPWWYWERGCCTPGWE